MSHASLHNLYSPQPHGNDSLLDYIYAIVVSLQCYGNFKKFRVHDARDTFFKRFYSKRANTFISHHNPNSKLYVSTDRWSIQSPSITLENFHSIKREPWLNSFFMVSTLARTRSEFFGVWKRTSLCTASQTKLPLKGEYSWKILGSVGI